MTNEQRTNADKLEKVAEKLRQFVDLFNLAGYKASSQEIAIFHKIKTLADICVKLSKM